MNIKNAISSILVFLVFFIPFNSFAQTPSGTYQHTAVGETFVTIQGQISGQGFQSFGYAIVFGSVQGLLINIVPVVPDISGNYSVEIKNLNSNTEYFYRMVFGLTAIPMGPIKSFKTTNSSLILNHKEINQTGAKLFGNVSPGHPNFVIKYGRTQDLSDGSFSLHPDEYGNFDEYFPYSLPPKTRIFYRAVNPLFPILVYSPIKNFTTLEESVTFDFRNVSSSAFSVFGSVTDGTPAPRILISTNGLLGSEIQNDPVLEEDNTWQADFSGLQPETQYFVRAAKTSDPTYTYLVKWITTTNSNINLQFFNITDSSMQVSGTLPFGVPSVVLCFATSEQALTTSPNCGSGPLFEAALDSNTFETTLTNLASNTTYYFIVRNSTNTANISDVFDSSTFPPPGPNETGGNIVVEGGPASLVPCDGLDCDFAQLMKLINNIIDFLLKTIALPLFAVLFAYVGWLFMSSADDPGKRSKAKTVLKNAIIGYIIALAAFLIIKVILEDLGYTGISFGILPI